MEFVGAAESVLVHRRELRDTLTSPGLSTAVTSESPARSPAQASMKRLRWPASVQWMRRALAAASSQIALASSTRGFLTAWVAGSSRVHRR
jgi:hypothetical protein